MPVLPITSAGSSEKRASSVPGSIPETGSAALKAGADPNREDKEGGSPYMAAYDKPEMKALLDVAGGRMTATQMAKRAYIELLMRTYRSH